MHEVPKLADILVLSLKVGVRCGLERLDHVPFCRGAAQWSDPPSTRRSVNVFLLNQATNPWQSLYTVCSGIRPLFSASLSSAGVSNRVGFPVRVQND